jgi:hypothetical protein
MNVDRQRCIITLADGCRLQAIVAMDVIDTAIDMPAATFNHRR